MSISSIVLGSQPGEFEETGNNGAKNNYGEATTIGCYIITTLMTKKRGGGGIPPREPFKSFLLQANYSQSDTRKRSIVKNLVSIQTCRS